MNTLYIECNMGAAGDMLTAALLELVEDKEGFVQKLNEMGLPGVCVKQEPAVKCGIRGTHMIVTVDGVEEESHDHHHDHDHEHDHEHDHHHDHEHEHDHEHHHDHEHDYDHNHDHHHEHHHHHAGMGDIQALVDELKVSEKVKKDIMEVYGLIAEAESHAHGVDVSQIHFHEVGTKDALADVAAVCLLMEQLGPDRVVVSPIHVGSGHVHCAHGVLPVPAPATAYLLQGIPSYSTEIRGELCTPTGAALLKYFADSFGEMPVMTTEKIGYGMGKKDFEMANCVRVFRGTSQSGADGEILELSCNLDDMTAEEIGYATEELMKAGARDVYTIPVGMKKNRPGILLCVYCDVKDRDAFLEKIFALTTTLGVRENLYKRYMLQREIVTEDSVYGPIRKKLASGYGVSKEKYEYDDLKKIADEKGISIREILKKL